MQQMMLKMNAAHFHRVRTDCFVLFDPIVYLMVQNAM